MLVHNSMPHAIYVSMSTLVIAYQCLSMSFLRGLGDDAGDQRGLHGLPRDPRRGERLPHPGDARGLRDDRQPRGEDAAESGAQEVHRRLGAIEDRRRGGGEGVWRFFEK